jgi:1-acyl-sn-glycerol-3-phosphate acyltransferase
MSKDDKIFNLKDLDTDKLLYHVLPRFIMELMRKYFRMEVEGLENLPKTGPCIIAPNHSGYAGFDAFCLKNEIYNGIKRSAKVMTHHFWFLSETTSIPANKVGFVDATTKNGIELLKNGEMIILFPEGEYGNFKPTSKAYKLQEFKRGFVRLAVYTGAPIVPTIVLGAEETHINLKELKFSKFLRGLVLPLPLNVLPLPARWKIKFLKPIYLPYKSESAKDSELMRELADDVRERLQMAIRKELASRKSVFL